MFKAIFGFLTEPLGLSIAWYWEYMILAVIGIIAYTVAFATVGDMYRADFISGKTSGSFFHWMIRLFIFLVLWAFTYSVIWLGQLVVAHWQIIIAVLGGIAGLSGLCALAIFLLQKSKNSKAVSEDA